MMTKAMIQYISIVWLIISLDLIAQCQCSQSANTLQTSVNRTNNSDMEAQLRKLPDDVESITTFSNVLSDDSQAMVADEMLKNFQYFNDPDAISSANDAQSNLDEASDYEQPLPPRQLPINHRPIPGMDLNQGFFPQMDSVPYVPSENFIPPGGPPITAIQPNEPIPLDEPPSSIDDNSLDQPTDLSLANKIVKVIREPFWAPDFYKLEHKYMSTLRGLTSSVVTFYYKMQDLVVYFLNLFKMPGEC